jgi:AcrR family transcriptional regulator
VRGRRTAALRTPREASSSTEVTARLRPPTGPANGSGSASVELRPCAGGVPEQVTNGRPLSTSSSPRTARAVLSWATASANASGLAERAGVTKSTFFRYFPDKRELLVAGQQTLSQLLTEAIAEAPDTATPLEAVAAGLERASGAMSPMNRELAPRVNAAVAANVELQERDALKRVGLAAAMTGALLARGVPEPIAHLAAELGVLAFKQGYTQWLQAHDDATLAPYTVAALDELRKASQSLT